MFKTNKKTLLFFILILLIFLFTISFFYSKSWLKKEIGLEKLYGFGEAEEHIGLSSIVWSPDSKYIAFARDIVIYRKATGINKFPNGGIPKYEYNNRSLYVINVYTKELQMIDSYNNDGIDGSAERNRIIPMSWRENKIYYYVHFPKPENKYLTYKKYYFFDTESDTKQEIFPNKEEISDFLKDRSGISPDERKSICSSNISSDELFLCDRIKKSEETKSGLYTHVREYFIDDEENKINILEGVEWGTLSVADFN